MAFGWSGPCCWRRGTLRVAARVVDYHHAEAGDYDDLQHAGPAHASASARAAQQRGPLVVQVGIGRGRRARKSPAERAESMKREVASSLSQYGPGAEGADGVPVSLARRYFVILDGFADAVVTKQ